MIFLARSPFKTKLKYAALADADFLLTWDLNLDLILKAALKARPSSK